MPERVHKRLDGDPKPLETASKKRKREQPDKTYYGEHAKSKLPIDKHSIKTKYSENDQRQEPTRPNGLHSTVSTKSDAKSRPEAIIRPPSDGQRLKERAQSLESSRKSLPIWSHVTEIRGALLGRDATILVGETGSGKSTQLPQMLVNEPWCKPQSVTIPKDPSYSDNLPGSGTISIDRSSQTAVRVGGCIAITEPRRVAVTTLARRVAEEMGSPLGSASPKSTVGYSVRFDQSTSPNTRIKFLTEGTLLQEMLRDPWLKAYSAVLVDEVHERGANVDLLLGFLRNMVAGKNEGRGGVPLKVRLCPD